MKKILIIIMLTSAAIGCKNEAPRTTMLGLGTPYFFANEFMKGQVKQVTETIYWAKDINNQIQKGEAVTWKELDSMQFSHSFTAFYDENGQITRSEYFDENGKVIEYWNGVKENNIVTVGNYFLRDSNTMNFYYNYDDKGGLIEASTRHPLMDTLFTKWIFTNNDKLLYDYIETYNYNNELQGKNVLQRNEDGLILKLEYYNKNDSLTFVDNLTYNDKNILDSQESFFKGKSNGLWNYTYDYEANGNWSTVICSINGKPLFIAEREYVYN